MRTAAQSLRALLGAAAFELFLAGMTPAASAQVCPPSTPVLCPAGSCARAARECAAIEGCPPSAPHRCANGACAQTDAACASAATPLEPGEVPATGEVGVEPGAQSLSTTSSAPPPSAASVPSSSAGTAGDGAARGLSGSSEVRSLEAARDATDAPPSDDGSAPSSAGRARANDGRADPSRADECPDDTPVDCADGTCASSIYACDADADTQLSAERPGDEGAGGVRDGDVRAGSAWPSAPSSRSFGADPDLPPPVSRGCATSAPGVVALSSGGFGALIVALVVALRLRRRRDERARFADPAWGRSPNEPALDPRPGGSR